MTNPVVREASVDEHGLVHAPVDPGIGYEIPQTSETL